MLSICGRFEPNWKSASGSSQTPVAERRTPAHPSGPGPDRERQRDDADGRALAYARSIWSATVQAGEVDAVRRYLARRWCWPPEIALLDCVHWLSVPAAEIASRRLPAGAAGALVWRFDVDAQALAAVQLEALTADGQRLTAWPSSSSTRKAKRLTHGRLRGAYLQLPAPEATALVLVEGPVDALAARWLHPGAVVWCCGGALRLDPGELPAGAKAARRRKRPMSESGEVLKEALQTARSEADILDALARRVEFVDGGEGEPEIPTVEALAGWLPMAPETARVEAGELLEQLPWPRMILDGHLVKDGDLERARFELWDLGRSRGQADPRRRGPRRESARGPERRGST